MADVEDNRDGDNEDEENDPGQDEEAKYPNLNAKARENVKEKFTIFDKENNGYVDTASLGTMLRWLNYNPTETELAEYVRTYDAQGKD